MIPFTSPFIWDGTSNIVINTCTGPNPFTAPRWRRLRYYTGTAGIVKYLRTDGTSNCATTVSSATTNKPNIRFDYTGGVCSGTPTPGIPWFLPIRYVQG
ncbi:MAG: hypothetical protein IPH45_19150 [Bacteroidales bacterium]|nr:hypothetical protein [Bacteroidales bacterium]